MVNPRKSRKASVAIIGAGMAGLACARRLKERGFAPVVFDKGRGLGGRIATRRTAEGLSFDHGAQYVTARSAAFRKMLEHAANLGTAAAWRPRVRGCTAGDTFGWTVGTPGMNAFAKGLAADIDVRLSTQVTSVSRRQERWKLTSDKGVDCGSFDFLVSAIPAPQALTLLREEPGVPEALESVSMAPCWALMVAFAAPLSVPFDVLRQDRGELAWLARNTAKPGRSTESDCWAAHASIGWSQRHLEEDPQPIAGRMLDLVTNALGATTLPDVIHLAAHRWRFARTTTTLDRPYVRLPGRQLYLGGDWCLGARVEAAFESGRAIADDLSAQAAA